jgi:signal transduction histidine kinase
MRRRELSRVHPFLLLIAASVLACAACAGAMYTQAGNRPGPLAAALALCGAAYWGLCQLALHLSADPHTALWIARASAPGWIFLGPLCLQVFMNASGARARWLERTVWGLFALSAAGLATALGTPWVIEDLRPASWGYGIVPGPLFVAVSGPNLIGAALGVAIGRRARTRLSDAENRQRRWISAAIVVPVVLISATDVLFPILGVLFPGLAPASFAPLAVLALWLRVRIGHSPLEPGQVAHEILGILPDGVALLGTDERIRLANRGLGKLCGCASERLEGVAIGELLTWDAEDSERAELCAAAGQTMPVSVSSAPLLDPIGGALGRVLVVRDLREVADLRSRLVTSARLAAVGELAAGIAHEINNPLAFVRSNLSQLEEIWKHLRPDDRDAAHRDRVHDVDELIEESIEGVDRAAEIVRSVKSFAHAGSASRERTDLRPLLEDVLHVASAQLRSRVTVQREYDDALPPVVCAPQQLRQVFLNLVVNAAQAVESGGHVLVATRTDGDDVIVSVADDGCGIAPELIDRIFDPFFTTKAVGEGTGLGLGIAHQIVTSHGGEIQVESTPGQGTVFRVRLPAATAD